MITPVTQNLQTVASGTASASLDRDAFLKILIEELRHQDPFHPVDARDFVTQLAQLRQLEVLEDMKDILSQILQRRSG